jgi:hypothetical protein
MGVVIEICVKYPGGQTRIKVAGICFPLQVPDMRMYK